LFLFRLHKLAVGLLPLLPFSLALALGGVALSIYALVGSGASPSPLLGLALILTLWALLLFAFIRLFQTIPAPVLPQDRFFERLWSRTRLLLYHLLALGVVVLGLSLISMSLKLIAATAAAA
jgi:hypothetical protein